MISKVHDTGPEIKDEDPGPAVHLRALGLANHDPSSTWQEGAPFDRLRFQLP